MNDTILQMARVIALHGLGTISGGNRQQPPNEKWLVDEWQLRILDCIPGAAEDRCVRLAEELYAIADTHAERGDEKQAPSLMSGGGARSAIAHPSPLPIGKDKP